MRRAAQRVPQLDPTWKLVLARAAFPGLVLLLAALLVRASPVQAGVPSARPTPTFTTSATVASSTVSPGAAVTIVASVSSSRQTVGLLDVEVYAPDGARVFQQGFDGQTFGPAKRDYILTWTVSPLAQAGRYTVKIGVFATGWTTLYHWNDMAAQIDVALPSLPTFTTSAMVEGVALSPSRSVRLSASVTSGAAGQYLVDVEVYGSDDARAFQRWFDNQTFAVGQTITYPVQWDVPLSQPAGSHIVKVGVFAPAWSSLYHWNDAAATFTLSPVASATSTATSTATARPTSTATSPPVSTSTPPPISPTPAATSSPTPTVTSPDGAKLFGVSVAGAEFGENHLPGVEGIDYVYPADLPRQQYFASKGLTLVRLPFRWERVQRSAFAPLAADDTRGIRSVLDVAHAAGQQVILDVHNYARYYGRPLERADAALLADLWERLAGEFRGHPALFGYELMNEPHDLPGGSSTWAYLAQAATDAIRKHDRDAWILAPGYGWQTARFWPENNQALDVRDPAAKLLYSAHQYFDADHSGRYASSYDREGAYPSVGSERLQPFIDWLAARNARGILTEYGVPDTDSRWLDVLDAFLGRIEIEPRIFGGTYWAAGPWWGSYPLSVEPVGRVDRPQMAVLASYPSQASTAAGGASGAPSPSISPTGISGPRSRALARLISPVLERG